MQGKLFVRVSVCMASSMTPTTGQLDIVLLASSTALVLGVTLRLTPRVADLDVVTAMLSHGGESFVLFVGPNSAETH